MNWIFSCPEAYNPESYDAQEECYEGYRDQKLANGYEAYGENGNAEAVYELNLEFTVTIRSKET